jgi:hypothetical protein
MLLAMALVGCATEREAKLVPVSAEFVQKAMTDVGNRSCTPSRCPPLSKLRDEAGQRHEVDADTLVGVADGGHAGTASSAVNAPTPSVTLSALWADCAAHPATSRVRCPVAGSQASYIALVHDTRSHLDGPKVPGYVVGGVLVAGLVAGEAGCFAKWCDGTSRNVVAGVDIVGVVAALSLWGLFTLVTMGNHGD